MVPEVESTLCHWKLTRRNGLMMAKSVAKVALYPVVLLMEESEPEVAVEPNPRVLLIAGEGADVEVDSHVVIRVVRRFLRWSNFQEQ